MFGPPNIDGSRLDDWITGHGGQDQFGPEGDDTDEWEEEPEEESDP